MSNFGIEPKSGSLAETYFTGKGYCYAYTDTYSLPAEITIDFIVRSLLKSTTGEQSPFQSLITYIRSVRKLEGTVQREMNESDTVKIGAELGCMCVIDRSPAEILLLENYSTSSFFVSFMMDKVAPNTIQLVISMNVLATGRFNKFYYTVCQPVQYTLASYVLKVSRQKL